MLSFDASKGFAHKKFQDLPEAIILKISFNNFEYLSIITHLSKFTNTSLLVKINKKIFHVQIFMLNKVLNPPIIWIHQCDFILLKQG